MLYGRLKSRYGLNVNWEKYSWQQKKKEHPHKRNGYPKYKQNILVMSKEKGKGGLREFTIPLLSKLRGKGGNFPFWVAEMDKSKSKVNSHNASWIFTKYIKNK